MFEYKVVQITRLKEKKTREKLSKKGKIETETYIEIEPFADFFARTEKTLNELASEDWQAINANYSLPIRGVNDYPLGYSVTDFDSAEFVVIMQRNK